MITTTTATVSGILPEEWGPLLIEPVRAAALAFNPLVATQVTTESHALHIPVVNADAAAAWVAEGSEITPSDPTISELKVTPAKVAGLTIVSSELAQDSDRSAAEMVGQSLARSIAAQVDAAFFGNLSSPAPSGLGSLTNTAVNRIVAGTAPTTLDGLRPGPRCGRAGRRRGDRLRGEPCRRPHHPDPEDRDGGDQRAALTEAAVNLARRAEAQTDAETASHLAAAARDVAEALSLLTAPRPGRQSRDGARSAVVQALRQTSAAKASASA